MTARNPIIEVRHLSVSVRVAGAKRVEVVRDASFSIGAQETLGLVGESGSGKTMACLAIMRLLPPSARVDAGEVLLDGENLLTKSKAVMERIRGKRISMVLQDAMSALDPVFNIRSQLAQPLRRHRGLRGAELDQSLGTALARVHLSGSKERLHQYPHQLSGGMRQRIVSAIGLAGEPNLLIADEPTTALDMAMQARYLDLLKDLQQSSGFALLLVAHDLHIVRRVCERVVVMYASQVVEEGPVEEVFSRPQHPYTRALIAAIPVFGEGMRLESIEGQAPDPAEEIVGCRFADRCTFAREICRAEQPALSPRETNRAARCWGTEPDGWIAP